MMALATCCPAALPCLAGRFRREATYPQPFLPDGARLCINCAKPVPGKAAAQPAEAVLEGMTNLFCRCGCCFGDASQPRHAQYA